MENPFDYAIRTWENDVLDKSVRSNLKERNIMYYAWSIIEINIGPFVIEEVSRSVENGIEKLNAD